MHHDASAWYMRRRVSLSVGVRAGMHISERASSRRGAGDIRVREKRGKCSKQSPSSLIGSNPHLPARTLSVFLWELGLAAGGAKGLLLVPVVVVDSVVSSVMMAGGGSIALAMASGGWVNVPRRVLCLLREVGRVQVSGQVAGWHSELGDERGYRSHQRTQLTRLSSLVCPHACSLTQPSASLLPSQVAGSI